MAPKQRSVEQAIIVTTMFVLMAFSAPGAADHPQETDGGTVTFDHRGGNEWWVEAVVTHAGSRPDEVHARDEGDTTWHALEFKDWGEWGGSFHIEPGHRVMFRSTDHALGAAESCWFTHPQGVEECDTPPPPPPPPGDFDATFDTPGGNEWWVEVYVQGNEPIGGVDARANEGSWHELTKRSWGAWAKSFHVPGGSIVEFRAHSNDGEQDLSRQYRWPSGEAVGSDPDPDPDPPAPLDAAFGPKASNEWWVETLAIAERDIDLVEARANGGAWHALTLRSWGSWATSFHAPEGSTVEFRAFDEDGAVSMSDGFLWPDAMPAADPNGDWPQEGSYARYDIRWGTASQEEGDVFATFVYHDGGWLVQCDGTASDSEGEEPFFKFDAFPPPSGPPDTFIGDEVTTQAFQGCNLRGYDLPVDEVQTHETHQEGDEVTVATWYGIDWAECGCHYEEAAWDQNTGLTVGFATGLTSWANGFLDDTDAPLRTV